MKKNMVRIACVLSIVLLAASSSRAGEQEYQAIGDLLGKASELHQAEKYKEAIETYGKVLDSIVKLSDDSRARFEQAVIICHYNVACAYSRLEETEKAIEALKQAVKAGWDDAEHMRKDSDFDNIRDAEEFKKILRELGGEASDDEPGDKPASGDEPAKKTEPVDAAGLERFRQIAFRHLRNKEYDEAVEAYKKALEIDPEDTNCLYNAACAYSLSGKKAEAVEYLIKAVEAGYMNFAHIKRDSDLDSVREEEGYKKLLEEKDKYLLVSADKIIERYKKRLGDKYTYQKNAKYKLVVISNVEAARLEDLRKSLITFAGAHWKDFFKIKPDYYITVLIPKSSEDYRKDFGGMSGAAGFYNPGTKVLTVNLSTGGGTMIHEFTHALHFGDMEGLGQGHPIWIIEGFGTLYEQCGIRDGSGYGLLNWRLPILKRAIADDERYPLRDFISKSHVYFSRSKSLSYAITRYIFYFMQEKKLLRKWYAKYRENYDKDKTGLKTLEEVYGKSIEEFEKEWLEFLKPLEYSRGGPSSDRPFLGVGLEDTDEGLKIAQVHADTPADKAGFEDGDIVLKMDDKEIETASDLRDVLAKHKIGDEVEFVVRRDGEEKEITVKLGKR